ncbi:clumping factor B-like [Microplitis mediator]|uniref:clumping factor B-like n=1 Tax=Microplitis mediator TaxID=375433 RepID=UPI0025532308|nr:clumping factor B-like [Microplitis mediator]
MSKSINDAASHVVNDSDSQFFKFMQEPKPCENNNMNDFVLSENRKEVVTMQDTSMEMFDDDDFDNVPESQQNEDNQYQSLMDITSPVINQNSILLYTSSPIKSPEIPAPENADSDHQESDDFDNRNRIIVLDSDDDSSHRQVNGGSNSVGFIGDSDSDGDASPHQRYGDLNNVGFGRDSGSDDDAPRHPRNVGFRRDSGSDDDDPRHPRNVGVNNGEQTDDQRQSLATHQPLVNFFENLWPEAGPSTSNNTEASVNVTQIKTCLKEFGGEMIKTIVQMQNPQKISEEFELPPVQNGKIRILGSELDADEVFKAKDVICMTHCVNHITRAYWSSEKRKKLALSSREGQTSNRKTIKNEDIEQIKKICKLIQKDRKFDKNLKKTI